MMLYQLRHIGVPLQLVEMVMFNGDQTISYRNNPFATVQWTDKDIPVFTFHGDYSRYNDILQQEQQFKLISETNIAGHQYTKPKVFGTFINQEQLIALMEKIDTSDERVHIVNGRGVLYSRTLLPLDVRQSSMDNKLNRLQGKFCK